VVRREGLELPAAFIATLNVEMEIGAVEETITVTGASPVVDAQGTTNQFSLASTLLDGLPTNRNPQGFAPMLPAVVGKMNSVAAESKIYSAHGSLSAEANVGIDGVYNVLNGSGATRLNTRYGPSWLLPTEIQNPRYFKVGAEILF
jgi:hypothetical protein